jgi:hypothetical protein
MTRLKSPYGGVDGAIETVRLHPDLQEIAGDEQSLAQ